MKLTLIIVLVLGCAGIITFPTYSALQEKESKTQPKEVTLAKDSQSDKYAEVAFNHENHATKKYSPDGSAVLTCVECHHTDQPAASLKPPLKTSERTTVLTAEELAGADSKPVKTCRACHLQTGDDSAPIPTVQYPDKPAHHKPSPSRIHNRDRLQPRSEARDPRGSVPSAHVQKGVVLADAHLLRRVDTNVQTSPPHKQCISYERTPVFRDGFD